MYRSQGSRPRHPQQSADMYDEEPSWDQQSDYYQRSPIMKDEHESGKDLSRNPHRGSAANRMNASNIPEQNKWHQNDGAYVNAQDHRRSARRYPHAEGGGRCADRDQEGYHSPSHGRSRTRSWSRSRTRSYSRSRSPSPYYGAPPSRTIILEGIPMNMTQEDVLAIAAIDTYIQILNQIQNGFKAENLQEIRLIRDKRTGLSRHFAFARFAALENARAFLDRYYPSIQLHNTSNPAPPGDGGSTIVRIAYSREKEERDRAGRNEDDWKCETCYLANYSHRVLCFRCNTPRPHQIAMNSVNPAAKPNMSTFSGFATTGDSDVSPDNTASQFLLFRGLEPGVTEELLAKGVMKLYKAPLNTMQLGIHAIKKPKKTSGTNDVGLGAREGSVQRILLVRDRRSDESWRYGFAEFSSVDDAKGAMAKYNAAEKFTISSKPVLVSYIHAGVFVPVLKAPANDMARFFFSPMSNPSARLMYWDEASYVSELITAKDDDLPSLAKAEEIPSSTLAAATTNDGLVVAGKDADAKARKRKAERDISTNSKKVVAPHLQFWSNRHAELHGLHPEENEEQEDIAPAPEPSNYEKSTPDLPPSQSFADMKRKCCLLCSRQFKTEAEVHRHETASQLHRDNLLNDDLKKKALSALLKSKIKQASTENSTYRDRAKERRQAFNQPKQPAAQHKITKEAGASIRPENEEMTPMQSKGAALLGKMGWTAGEGLGAQGTGRKDAIVTEAYTQGVGLGAQGGKIGDAIEEAERSTRGSYADFVNKSKEKAKERFQGMS